MTAKQAKEITLEKHNNQYTEDYVDKRITEEAGKGYYVAYFKANSISSEIITSLTKRGFDVTNYTLCIPESIEVTWY